MQMSVYLSDSVITELKAHGGVNYAVNYILELCENGYIDIENKPRCHSRDLDRRVNIEVTNSYYLNLLYNTGNSSKISLRRLIYWFVDNDMFSAYETVYKLDVDELHRTKIEMRQHISESLRSLILAHDCAMKIDSPFKNNIRDVMEYYNEKLNKLLQDNDC